jgi:hypothetical protein
VNSRAPDHWLPCPVSAAIAFLIYTHPGGTWTTGDYDGLDDYAVWRPSAMPAQFKSIIRRSINTAVLLEVFAGENGDYPVGNARVN